jgi:hypothetical protein
VRTETKEYESIFIIGVRVGNHAHVLVEKRGFRFLEGDAVFDAAGQRPRAARSSTAVSRSAATVRRQHAEREEPELDHVAAPPDLPFDCHKNSLAITFKIFGTTVT